jgi:GT2 family glycosyltransferase
MSLAISIVVPAHGRAALTRRCLDAVLAEVPGGCEVVVVDDASTDDTPELLDSYGEAIRWLRLPSNRGYATACNEGAAAATGEALLFLNNDTVPSEGWLGALASYAEAHPRATVVGAKLLYPTGAVQHAGVAIGQDGYPHNLYAGLPAGHPAVNRSRRLQAVTGACMLVRRSAFERVGGFDTGFVNSLEDVDLCLRIGAMGGEVHYCHEAVLTHLESASRGRVDRFAESVELYRRRWREEVRRDDLEIYAADGLLGVEYAATYPARIEISPSLAVVGGGRELEAERLLEGYARQVADLLGEVVRLTAALGGEAPGRVAAAGNGGAIEPAMEPGASLGHAEHAAFVREANRLEQEVRELQLRLQEGGVWAPAEREPFSIGPGLGYRRLVERVRAEVGEVVPAGASVLVVSRGDRALLALEDRAGQHFPQDPSGGYLGHHPRDSTDAVAHLEALRGGGAEYLVLPRTAYWWLEHYDGFAEHLRDRYATVERDACTIFRLDAERDRAPIEGGPR